MAWYEMIFTSDNDAAHLEDNAKYHISLVQSFTACYIQAGLHKEAIMVTHGTTF